MRVGLRLRCHSFSLRVPDLLITQRYYLYPVHISLSFMFTPTLASALYVMLLRFLHRDYNEVVRLGTCLAEFALAP